jgi:hypothetical protein
MVRDPAGLRRRTLLAALMGMGAVAVGPFLRPPLARAADGSPADGVAGGPDSAGSDQVTSYEPSQWMRIPRIGVDSDTVEVGVTDGYYGCSTG